MSRRSNLDVGNVRRAIEKHLEQLNGKGVILKNAEEALAYENPGEPWTDLVLDSLRKLEFARVCAEDDEARKAVNVIQAYRAQNSEVR